MEQPHVDEGVEVEQGIIVDVTTTTTTTTTTTNQMKPMDISTSQQYETNNDDDGGQPQQHSSSHFMTNWLDWLNNNSSLSSPNMTKVPSKYKLATETHVRKHSMWTLQFAVAASAISTKMLNPNYAIMVTPGAHPDSFPNTDPFDFNSATYFLPMCSLLGVAIASIFLGPLSDKIGRKQPLVYMAAISCGGNIVKYYTRHTFWGFCISNFIFGFFLGNLPVGMAYVGDVYTTKREKETQLGILVGNFVMGNSGGGMIAILMNGSGLFAPLWVGAGLMLVATILLIIYFVESGDDRLAHEMAGLLNNKKDGTTNDGVMKTDNDDDDDDEGDGGNVKRPDTIDQTALWNVVGGALADNFGSTALFPLCLSPLALETFYFSFVNADPPQDPLMEIVGYQWLSVCVALMVVPSTLMTPHVFEWIGPSGTCVFGNVFTGFLTMALLFIGNINPPTQVTFAFFVFFMYGGFPFTVFSQLTTGPMLDVIAPEDKIGFVQGLNNSAMNFGMAVAPWLFGILADSTSTNTAIWTGIGISFLAGLINAPLMRRKEMGPPPKRVPTGLRVLSGDDDPEAAERALNGEYVAPEIIFALNRNRAKNHKQYIVPTVRPYQEEKDQLDTLRNHADETYRFRSGVYDRILTELGDPNSEVDVRELCDLLQTASGGDEDIIQSRTHDVGQWVGDYLLDNGYHPHITSLLIKQMVMTAFPSLSQDRAEITPENIEPYLLRVRQVMHRYHDFEDDQRRYSIPTIFGNGVRPQFYS